MVRVNLQRVAQQLQPVPDVADVAVLLGEAAAEPLEVEARLALEARLPLLRSTAVERWGGYRMST